MGAIEISALGGFLCVFLALGAISAGLVGLGRWKRDLTWWAMLSGVVLVVLGIAAWLAGIPRFVEFYSGSSAGRPAWYGMIAPIGLGAFSLGILIFSLGFCIHGFRVARMAARTRELEDLASTMGDEMNRMRRSGD